MTRGRESLLAVRRVEPASGEPHQSRLLLVRPTAGSSYAGTGSSGPWSGVYSPIVTNR